MGLFRGGGFGSPKRARYRLKREPVLLPFFFYHGFCNASLPDNFVTCFKGFKKEALELGEFMVWCSVLKYVIGISLAGESCRGLFFGNAGKVWSGCA